MIENEHNEFRESIAGLREHQQTNDKSNFEAHERIEKKLDSLIERQAMHDGAERFVVGLMKLLAGVALAPLAVWLIRHFNIDFPEVANRIQGSK